MASTHHVASCSARVLAMIAHYERVSSEWEDELRAIGIVDYSDQNQEDALARLTSDTVLMELTRRISAMQSQLPTWYWDGSP